MASIIKWWKSLQGYKLWKTMTERERQVRSFAIGTNSTVDIHQDLHIVMLDYDIKDIQKVEESIWELQEFWQLSDAYIYRTRNGHHVFFWFDHVPYSRLKMIIEYAKYVDPLYKYISRYHDHKTIRAAGKYRHKDIIFLKKFAGKRTPTDEEFARGRLKQQMHEDLLKL